MDIKTKEEGGVRVEALHPLSGELKLGSLQKYESNYCAGGLVLFDDDAIVSSKGENNTFEKKKIEAQPLLVHEMRIIQSSRGLFVPILGYLYQAVIKRQPLWTLENNNTTVHIVNLETELTMLSIAREQGLEENKIERVSSKPSLCMLY